MTDLSIPFLEICVGHDVVDLDHADCALGGVLMVVEESGSVEHSGCGPPAAAHVQRRDEHRGHAP